MSRLVHIPPSGLNAIEYSKKMIPADESEKRRLSVPPFAVYNNVKQASEYGRYECALGSYQEVPPRRQSV